jgi:hypothetical protein
MKFSNRHLAKSEFWSKHIEKWRSSGLLQKEYCANAGLHVKSFGRWKSILAKPSRPVDSARGTPKQVKKATPKSLIPLSIISEAGVVGAEAEKIQQASSGIRLHTPGKHVIELAVGFDSSTLRQLLGVVC